MTNDEAVAENDPIEDADAASYDGEVVRLSARGLFDGRALPVDEALTDEVAVRVASRAVGDKTAVRVSVAELTSEIELVPEFREVFDGIRVLDSAAVGVCVKDVAEVKLWVGEDVALDVPASNVPLGELLDFREAVALAQKVGRADEEGDAVVVAERLGDALADVLAVPGRVGNALAELDEETSGDRV